jgi:hypothetical protein
MSTGANESASMVNAYEGKKASKRAAQVEADANAKAQALQEKIYEENKVNLRPYAEAGEKSLNTIQNLQGYNGADAQASSVSAFRADPGYQYAVDQSNKGLERSALKAGGLNSGNFATALQANSQGLADQQYSNYYNRLWNTANMGRGTATGVAQMGTQYANTQGGLYQNAGAIASQNFWNQYNLQANAFNTVAAGAQYSSDKTVNTAASLYGMNSGSAGSWNGGSGQSKGSGQNNSMYYGNDLSNYYGGGGGYGSSGS